MFRLLQHPSAVLLTVAAAAAGVFLSTPAQAEGIDFKDGQSIVAIRFVDQCDGGTKVQVPNPYKTGDLVFKIDLVVVVVGPGQAHWESVPAPTGGADLVVRVQVRNQAGKAEKTTHHWTRPQLCDTDAAAADSGGTNPVSNAEPDAQGYGSDDETSGVTMGASGSVATDTGSAASEVDQTDLAQVSSTATAEDAAAESPALALTGTSIIPMVAAGLAMLVGGVALLRLCRRRIHFKVQ